MSALVFREANENDAPLLLDLRQRAFEEYRGVLTPPSGVHKETVQSAREKMNTERWVIAERAGQAVGCVMYKNEHDHFYLGRLSVPPEFRRQGIASALIAYVENQARAENILRVRLGVRIALTENRAMYERRGYRFLQYETHEGFSEPTYATLEKTLE